MAEGARLESVCRGNPTVGSNPTLSAIRLASLAVGGEGGLLAGEHRTCGLVLWARIPPAYPLASLAAGGQVGLLASLAAGGLNREKLFEPVRW